MARQQTFFVSGKLENIIFYNFRGTPFARTMPVRVRQTKATKNSAALFGLAARTGRLIREGLYPLYHDLTDPTIMQRLNSALIKCLNAYGIPKQPPLENLSFLTGFVFHDAATFYSRFKKKLQLAPDRRGVGVTIPKLNPVKDISAPAHTKTVILKLGAVACNLDKTLTADQVQREITIPYIDINRPAQTAELSVPVAKNQLVVIAAALRYIKGTNMESEERRWMPVEVVGTYWSGS
ncbi:MAG TPA: hypothetical protein VFH07_09150 [Chitinophagaceae bacterium]|nr:hypothetical protein [Chitinophagaceae bacterium]